MTATPLVSSYTQQLTEQMRHQILSGQLEPGERLREESFARTFGVSRGPVRDSFLQLTKEGLLVARPHAGVHVAAPPSPFKRKALVHTRRNLETRALREGMRTAPESLLSGLRVNLAQYREVCRREDLQEVVALDMEFHRLIIRSADGGSLLAIWQPAMTQMLLRYSRHHSLMDSFAEHDAIMNALEAGDLRAAVQRLRNHIV